MGSDPRIDHFGAERLQPVESPLLVGLDEARVPGDIRRKDRGEPTFCIGGISRRGIEGKLIVGLFDDVPRSAADGVITGNEVPPLELPATIPSITPLSMGTLLLAPRKVIARVFEISRAVFMPLGVA